MNLFFRICVAIYSFISIILFGIIMIAPFGDKKIMAMLLDYFEINLYQSNAYDVVVFLIGFVFFLLNLYTRFVEYLWDNINRAIFFLLLAISFWLVGRWSEKIWKKKSAS